MWKQILLTIACGLIAACGGSSSGSDASPPSNDPPVISGTPATSVTVGQAYSFTPTASDPEGRTLTFSISGKPSWASFSTSNGNLSGTPTSAHVGSYAGIVISVSDGTASASLPSFAINVVATSPANQPPVISGTPATSVTVGQAYSFTPTASDPDGQTLKFSIGGKPSWANFSTSNGQLSGTPTSAHVGSYSGIVISVSDGTASASLPSFAINVVAAPSSAAELNWTVPTRNEDGSVLTDLAGYKVRYGLSPSTLTQVLNIVGPQTTSASIEGLATGTWYFSIASYTSAGTESQPTRTVNVTLP